MCHLTLSTATKHRQQPQQGRQPPFVVPPEENRDGWGSLDRGGARVEAGPLSPDNRIHTFELCSDGNDPAEQEEAIGPERRHLSLVIQAKPL